MGIDRELNRHPTRRDLAQFGLIFLAGTGVPRTRFSSPFSRWVVIAIASEL